MNTKWSIARLGDVLQRVERFEPRDEITEYPFAGTYSFARGIFVGERKLGSTFALSKIQRIQEGDFVYCKIIAWEGAFGIVPREAHGCVMSGAFVVYELDRDRIDPKFIEYFFKVPAHWQNIGSKSSGTNVRRQSLHPTQFEKAEIPLPPLAEQRRIVTRIEELAAQIEEAKALRKQAAEEVEALIASKARELLAKARASYGGLPLLEVCDFEGGSQPPKNMFRFEPTPGYVRFLQIRDFSSDDYLTFIPDLKRNSMVEPHEVLVGRYGASLGKILRRKQGAYNVAMCKAVPKKHDLDFDFLALSLEHGAFQERLSEISRSAQAGFNKSDLRDIKFTLPPVFDQRRIVAEFDALQAEVDKLKRLQAETAAELDALLPSILDKAFKGEL